MSKVQPEIVINGFLQNNYIDDKGNRTLHYYRDNFWHFTGQSYEILDDTLLEKWLDAYVQQYFATATNGDWSRYLRKLRYMTLVHPNQAMPAWFGAQEPNTETISFKNGLLELGSGKFQPHSPLWFSSGFLPYNYDEAGVCPKWLRFLNEVFESDPERIALLQEWFGYCLTPDTSQQKAMVFYGVPRGGKGTCVYVLRHLLGWSNTSEVLLELFGERFQLFPTIGKLLNVCEEADRVKTFHEGIFKTMVAGESLMLEDKGSKLRPAKTTARILIVSNDAIPFRDPSGAVAARLQVLPFFVSFLGHENLNLGAELISELPGIFNWALEGKKRLQASGKFSRSALGESEKTELVLSNNHALEWAQHCLEKVEPELGETIGTSIYEDYTAWCKSNGVKPREMVSSRLLVAQVRKALKLPRDWKPEPRNGVRVWRGIKLVNAPEQWLENPVG